MSSEDSRADYLESGSAPGLRPDDVARLDEIRSVLADESTWADPPDGLLDEIDRGTLPERPPTPRKNWVYALVAAAIAVLGTVAVFNLADEGQPSVPVAVITLSGTDLAAEVIGTAGLFPTPNGWAINFDVAGLEPAAPGTFYQAWVDNGSESVSVGTFHMRGEKPTAIGLWAGVDLHEYRTLNVTLQDEGAGPDSSGILVITGTAAEFD